MFKLVPTYAGNIKVVHMLRDGDHGSGDGSGEDGEGIDGGEQKGVGGGGEAAGCAEL